MTLLEAEADQVQFERFYHPHPLLQKKMEVVWLKHQIYGNSDFFSTTI
jgi:hypothetical protein